MNPHTHSRATDFKSAASANFAIRACLHSSGNWQGIILAVAQLLPEDISRRLAAAAISNVARASCWWRRRWNLAFPDFIFIGSSYRRSLPEGEILTSHCSDVAEIES